MIEGEVMRTLFYDVLRAERAAAQLVAAAIVGSGLSPMEYAVYHGLTLEPGSTVTEIAGRHHTPLTTMADILARPTQRGHIERSRAPHDGRAWELRLTEAGTAVYQEAHTRYRAAYGRFLERSGIDVAACRAMLEHFRMHVAAVTAELGTPADGET